MGIILGTNDNLYSAEKLDSNPLSKHDSGKLVFNDLTFTMNR